MTVELKDSPVIILDKRIRILEERIDILTKENKMRQDTIGCMDSAYDEACVLMEGRLDKLEGYMKMEDRVTATDFLLRIKTIEDFIGQNYAQDMKDIFSRVDECESEYLRLELNRKILFERINQVESSLALEIYSSKERLASIELTVKSKEFKADMDVGNRYMECLSGVEIKLREEMEDIESRLKSIHGTRPYKCPVCDGYGGTIISGAMDEECRPCQGKGIVWG